MKQTELELITQNVQKFNEKWERENSAQSEEALMEQRRQFCDLYNRHYLEHVLTLETYCYGGHKADTFCYKLEQSLSDLGSVRGGVAGKYIVYLSNKDKCYKTGRHIHDDVLTAFGTVKHDLLAIYDAARDNAIEQIGPSKFWYIVKYKIYWTYNPDNDIPVFSKEHVNKIIRRWGIETDGTEAGKRKALFDFKRKHPGFAAMSNFKFMRFLYSSFSRLNLQKEAKDDSTEPYDTKQIPLENFIGKYIHNPRQTNIITKHRKVARKNVDYEKINRKKRTLGMFGELLILNDETSKLAALGIDKTVEHTSVKKGDGLGYDIMSYDRNGNELYIEVKTTCVNRPDGFFLSRNERDAIRDYGNSYRLYRVYGVDSKKGLYKVAIFTAEQLTRSFVLEPIQFLAKYNDDEGEEE